MPAIEASIASGINVNVTLLFAVELYEHVAHAYSQGSSASSAAASRAAVARAVAAAGADVGGELLRQPRRHAVDKLLGDKIAAGGDVSRYEALLGQAAIANARLAYAQLPGLFSGPTGVAGRARRAGAAAAVGQHQHQEPALPRRAYVEELIGPDTVNTVPPATLEALKDHGRVTRTVDTPDALRTLPEDNARIWPRSASTWRRSPCNCNSRA